MTRVNQEIATVLGEARGAPPAARHCVYTHGAGSVAEAAKFIGDEYALWQQALHDIGLEPQ